MFELSPGNKSGLSALQFLAADIIDFSSAVLISFLVELIYLNTFIVVITEIIPIITIISSNSISVNPFLFLIILPFLIEYYMQSLKLIFLVKIY